MKLLVTLCVLVAICFAVTDDVFFVWGATAVTAIVDYLETKLPATAITCYECVYYEGHANSDAQCQKSPSADRTCSSTAALSLNPNSLSLKAQYRLNDTLVYSTDAAESRQEWMVLCTKFTGSMDGKSVIARGCILGYRELIGTCSSDVYLEIEGRNATNVQGCFCSGDRCNSASGIQATYILLITATIVTMYRFVAA